MDCSLKTMSMKKYPVQKGDCPKFCNSIGCFYTIEKRTIGGKAFSRVRVIRCKELDKVSDKALGFIQNSFKK